MFNFDEFATGDDAFTAQRIDLNGGLVLTLIESLACTGLPETELLDAIERGDLAAYHNGHNYRIHLGHLEEFMHRFWEEQRVRAGKKRVSWQARRELFRRLQAGAGRHIIVTCPKCGAELIAERLTPVEVDDLKYWQDEYCGTCAYCGYEEFFGMPAGQAQISG